jgi:hypothetical protein
MRAALVLLALVACSCAASLPRRTYPTLSIRPAEGDTLWAVNGATGRWQLCFIDREQRVRFIRGTECGPKLASWRVR